MKIKSITKNNDFQINTVLKINYHIFLFLLPVLIITSYFFSYPIDNNDIWFHLEIGKDLWQNKRFQLHDTYSYTSKSFYLDHEWLTQILYYFIYSIAGLKGIIVARVIIINTIISILAFEFKKFLPFHLFLIVPLILLATSHASDRPHLFSWLLQLILILLIHRKKYYLIMALIILWSNMHASFILAIAVTSVFILKEWLENKETKWLIIFLMLLVCPMINPFGWKIYFFANNISNYIWMVNEWLPYKNNSIYALIWALTIVFSLCFYFINSKVKWVDIPIFIFLIALSFNASRFPIVVCLYFFVFIFQESDKLSFYQNNSKFIHISIISAILGLVMFFKFSVEIDVKNYTNKLVDNKQLPFNSLRFIDQNQLNGRILNDYNFGGYFIFNSSKNCKVFIDGRLEVYAGKVLDDYIKFSSGKKWEPILQKYHIETIVIRPERKVNNFLIGSKKWDLVYFDYNSIIYVKHEFNTKLKRIVNITPWGNRNSKNIDSSIKEANYLLKWNNEFYGAHKILSFLYLKSNQYQKAEYHLKEYLRLFPKGIESNETQSLMKYLY